MQVLAAHHCAHQLTSQYSNSSALHTLCKKIDFWRTNTLIVPLLPVGPFIALNKSQIDFRFNNGHLAFWFLGL